MKKNKKYYIILWIKRIVGIMTAIIWSYIIYLVYGLNIPLKEQLPYCMGSTIVLFTLVSLLFKGLEYWAKEK